MVADSLAAAALEPLELSGERLFQALGDNAYELDREFRYLTYNEGCAAYYGTPCEIALGRPIWDVFPEIRDGPLEQLLRAAMAERRPVRVEMAGVIRPERWVEVTAFPTARGLGVAFRDRTQEHRAEEGLRASEERLRDLLTTLDLGASMARDLDGTIQFWSEGCTRLYGWTAREAVGRKAHALLHTAFSLPPPEIEAALERDGEWTGDLQQVTRDGRTLVVAARKVLRRGPHGQPVAVLEAVVDVTAQRATEAALADSEARLALATTAADIGIWDWDLLANRFVYSLRAKAICGFAPDQEVTFEDVRRITHPEDLPRTAAAARRALDPAIRERAVFEYRIVRPDGAVRRVMAHGEPVFAAVGGQERAVRYVGTLRDVTDHWRLQEERFASEARLRLAVEAGRMAVWEVDILSGSVTISPELKRVLGFPADANPTLDEMRERSYPGEQERLRAIGQAAFARGERFFKAEYRYLWPDGSMRWLQLRAELYTDADGQPVRAVGVVLDITDHKRAEEALRDSEAGLRLAQEAGGVGVWDVDLITLAVRWSPELYALFGLDPDRHGPMTMARSLELVHPDDRSPMKAAWASGRKSGVFSAEFRALRRTPDGATDERWMLSRGRHLDTSGGTVGRIVGVNVDITDRKRSEERQQLLAREVDHRAKNALAVVQAALRLTSKDDPAAYVRAVEGRVTALARAQTLLARGQWSGADLRLLLEDELAPFLADGDSAPRVRLEGPPVMLWPAAAQALSMAMHELATNAVKHGALGVRDGQVAIRWSRGPNDHALRLEWIERGGPPLLGAPARRGFGTRVLEGTVRAQLGGNLEREWSPEGLKVALAIPLVRGSANRAGDASDTASMLD